MLKRLLLASLVGVIAISLTPAVSFAATAPGTNAQVSTQIVPLSQAECQALADADPADAGQILNHCYATVTFTLGALSRSVAPSARQVQAMAASGCTWRGSAQGSYSWQSFPSYTVTVTAHFGVDTCNEVIWDWVSCSYSWLWPWTITQTWCGAYPGKGRYYYYTGTNVGIDYVASTLVGGSTHGARWGLDIPHWTYTQFSW